MAMKLLNSAVMPKEGQYSAYKISFQEFKLLLQKAHKRGELESYIGYPQNIELIRKWTGIEVPLNRAETNLDDGDEILVMKLRYRVSNPADKGKEVKEEDFEFFYIKYRSL